ncbi:DUF4249 domain-containing protein [Alkalitalea saponilacus]|uniref:DUF4249 domain-containing protein n=1 Tax=Alkalitalea saponilacus TaxID=889453 RepID=A0A1T5H514_9BACT|nr:DUF4249 domain-containing protein [Alkalitalea saponilacus]ASB50880.1 hypothetical protein CDL62_17855 [Alkalitalea saponilacus]SKC15764.1 protein of unknown function [Alkalitalea saponilacus]
MRFLNISTPLLFIVLLFSSCEEEIHLNLKSDAPRLVVDGIITTDTMAHRVRLTTSGSYFENKPMPGVSGASVSISDGYETIYLEESADSPGDYFTPENYYGRQNHLYTLTITNAEVDGRGGEVVYSASSFLPPIVPMDSIRVDYFSLWDIWRVFLYGQDPPDVKNFYWFRLKINDWWHSSEYKYSAFSDDTFFDGNYADGVWLFWFNSEDEYNLVPGDELMVEVWMVDEPFFEFIRGAYIETEYRSPIFSGPPANVPGNISNGALGIFSASSVVRLYTTNTFLRQ